MEKKTEIYLGKRAREFAVKKIVLGRAAKVKKLWEMK